MAPDLVGDMILATLYIGEFCTVFAICRLVADYALPRFQKAERALFCLFGLDPDEYKYDQEEKGGTQ